MMRWSRPLRMLLAAAWWAAVPVPAAEPERAARPNILWLVAEDSTTSFGCYGDDLARTPAIDGLAARGVVFDRCFLQPVCAPSRFALVTGLFSAACGPAEHMRAQGRIPAGLVAFPHLLREAGYYTTNAAKTDYNAPLDVARMWHASGATAHYRDRPDPRQPTDAQIGRLLAALDEAGVADDTIVFFFADNGGVLPRSKRFLHASGTRVPLVVSFPDKWRHLAPAAPGDRHADPVCGVDFSSTVLALAGVPIPDHGHGRPFAGRQAVAPPAARPREYVFCSRDRMDARYDTSRSVIDRRWLYIRNFRPDIPYAVPLEYMFRARGWQSWARLAREGRLTAATARFWGPKPVEELYDLDADPHNVVNLAADPAHGRTLIRMREALKQQTLRIVDNGFLPEGSPLEGYEPSRRGGAYPLERVYDVAVLAATADRARLPELLAALDDPSEPVRWWAAQGCTVLGRGDHADLPRGEIAAALARRCADPSGGVRVAVAEALDAVATLAGFEAAHHAVLCSPATEPPVPVGR
ncbi:MAG: sulfatase [Planctomycetia bacterium]|nr:sulfatase [Planctomycetia bacterium]